MITQTIDLSMTPEITILPEVYCSQYDNGIREIIFNLFTDETLETPYTIPSGMTAIVQGTKPDGNAYAQTAIILSGRNAISVTIGTQMAAVAGIVPSEIVISNATTRIGSLNFLLLVEEAGIRDDAVVSDSEIPGYVDLAVKEAAAEAEAWANGTREGVPVPETDPAYHNNAKWYSEVSGGTTLAALTDVNLRSPQERDMLAYETIDGVARWRNIRTPLSSTYGGTGNTNGYIQKGRKSGSTIGDRATIEGYNNIASGTDSHAEGSGVTASGASSHAEGEDTRASALTASARGRSTTANAIAASSEGQQTQAAGYASHAGGAAVSTDDKVAHFVHGASNENAVSSTYNVAYSKFNNDTPATNLGGFVFGFAPHWSSDRAAQPHIGETSSIDGKKGCSATIGGVSTVSITLEPAAIYLLFCNAFTLATGAIYGATARLISCLPTADGTPNILSLGQTTNAPATIAAAANHTITIANAAAARAAQFTLIRVA